MDEGHHGRIVSLPVETSLYAFKTLLYYCHSGGERERERWVPRVNRNLPVRSTRGQVSGLLGRRLHVTVILVEPAAAQPWY